MKHLTLKRNSKWSLYDPEPRSIQLITFKDLRRDKDRRGRCEKEYLSKFCFFWFIIGGRKRRRNLGRRVYIKRELPWSIDSTERGRRRRRRSQRLKRFERERGEREWRRRIRPAKKSGELRKWSGRSCRRNRRRRRDNAGAGSRQK